MSPIHISNTHVGGMCNGMSNHSKRLFVVKGADGKIVTDDSGEPMYFRTKPAAKLVRNEKEGRYVTYGPDHRKTLEATQRGGNS